MTDAIIAAAYALVTGVVFIWFARRPDHRRAIFPARADMCDVAVGAFFWPMMAFLGAIMVLGAAIAPLWVESLDELDEARDPSKGPYR